MARVEDWNHCPRCGRRVHPAGGRLSCDSCGFVVYAHSDPTACALVADGAGRVLLARRAHDPRRGTWDVPGGFLEEGEHPLDALRRELREETGLEIEPLEFVGVWMDRYGEGEDAPWTMNLYWKARAVGGELAPADDVDELRWFGLDELPAAGEIAFANVVLALREFAEPGLFG